MRQRVRKAILVVSLLLFPITMNYLSPYVSISGAADGILTAALVLFAAMFVSALVLGRAWCAWVCPVAGLAEACTAVNGKPVNIKRLRIVRYIVWGIWAGMLVTLLALAGGFHSVNLLHLTDSGVSVDEPVKYFNYLTVLAALVALFFALGRRGACHAVCWMSPFMEAGNKLSRWLHIPHLHIAAKSEQCNACGACTHKCPMSIDVKEYAKVGGVETTTCILCGECVDGCPKKVLSYKASGK